MLGQAILDKARDMIGDSIAGSSGFRLTDAAGLLYIIDACHDLWSRRDISLVAAGTNSTFPTITLGGAVTGFDDMYLEPLGHYVASRSYEHDIDDDYTAKLATRHMNLYRMQS